MSNNELYKKYSDLLAIYKKYHILTDGLQRLYLKDAFEKQYGVDFITPLFFIALIKNKVIGIQIRSWSQAIEEILLLMQMYSPKSIKQILNFKTEWYFKPIFDGAKRLPSGKKMIDGVYLNMVMGAQRSNWLIADLLKFYGVKKSLFLVHQASSTEPFEVKEIVFSYRKSEFIDFLFSSYNFSSERREKIANSIVVLNKVLAQVSKNHNNFYLLDDAGLLSKYKSRVLKITDGFKNWTDAQKHTARKYLDYFSEYFTLLKKDAANHKDAVKVNKKTASKIFCDYYFSN